MPRGRGEHVRAPARTFRSFSTQRGTPVLLGEKAPVPARLPVAPALVAVAAAAAAAAAPVADMVWSAEPGASFTTMSDPSFW